MTIVKNKPIEIWFTDLAHDSNTFKSIPLGIGCVAAYTKKVFGDLFSFRFFKFPNKFVETCLKDKPIILGMTNGVWNCHLSYSLVTKLKKIHPDTIIVFGGPNCSSDPDGQLHFLREHPLVDFCFFHDSERSFPKLLKKLIDFDFDVVRLKQAKIKMAGCNYLSNGDFITGDVPERIDDLTEIPSPYLLGFFDDFLQEKLDPLLQPTRGCPFSCSYCTEGQKYHSKIAKLDLRRFDEELRYIAERIKYKETTLHLGDANFGMFPRDIEVCRIISKIQEQYGWPNMLNASLGKDNFDTIMSAFRLLKSGTIWYSAAIQTTDSEVLENVHRKNIATKKILETACRSTQCFGGGSNTEIILNLPGDTVGKHLKTLRTVMEAGINRIRLYPLALLPGTEVESLEHRKKFQIKSRFRIFPRTYGIYRFGSELFSSAEISELAVETSSMSFEDYIYCRLFDLSIELFYNDGYFFEVERLLNYLNISMFDFIKKSHDLLSTFPEDLKRIYDGLRNSILHYSWESKKEFFQFAEDLHRVTQYSNKEHESSLATDRAIGIFLCAESLHKVAKEALNMVLDQHGVVDQDLRSYVDDLLKFSLCRKNALLKTDIEYQEEFLFNFVRLHNVKFEKNPLKFKNSKKQKIRFWHKGLVAEEIRNLYSAKDTAAKSIRNILFYSIAAHPADYYFRSFEQIINSDSKTVYLDKKVA